MHAAGRGAGRAGRGQSSSEAKLALAEFLLASADLQASARRAIDWLVAHTRRPAGRRRASPSPAANQLLLVAEHGISSGAIVDFVADARRRGASARQGDGARASRPTSTAPPPSFRVAARRRRVPRRSAARRTTSGRATGCCSSARAGARAPRRKSPGWRATLSQAGVAAPRAGRRSPRRASGRSGCCSTASSTPSPTRSCSPTPKAS